VPAQCDATPEGDKNSFQIVSDMHRAGVPLLAGTDVMNPFLFPGFSLHDELALLVKAGLTPMEAVQTATRNAAQYLDILKFLRNSRERQDRGLGGAQRQSFDDIHNTQKISCVMLGGRSYLPIHSKRNSRSTNCRTSCPR